MIWFARHLLPAFAVRTTDDPDLPDGLHLRILPAGVLGVPITPFLVYPLMTRPERTRSIPTDLGDGERRVAVPDAERGAAIVAAEAVGHDPRGMWLAAMHDDGLRLAARRSDAPFVLAAPRLDQLRASPGVDAVQFYSVRPSDLEKLVMSDPEHPPLALPVNKELAWYAGGDGRDGGEARVRAGAPRRTTPVDDPAGAFADAGPDEEWERVAASAGDLDALLTAMLGDATQTPGTVTLERTGLDEDGVPQQSTSTAASELALHMIDPGAARYLGLAARLKAPRERNGLAGLGAVALFAIPKLGVRQLLRGNAGPPVTAADDDVAIERFATLFPGVRSIVANARANGMWVGAISTVAAAPPPPDAPKIPRVAAQLGRWITNDDGGAFAQGFVLSRPPVAPLIAVARSTEAGFETRHEPATARRRRLRLMGNRLDPAGSGERQGIVFDQPIRPAPAAFYRLHLGDLFGRYGPPSDCPAEAPTRPAPPTPVVQTDIRRRFAPLPPAGAESPGTLVLSVPVPAVDDLAIGALPIAAVKVVFGDHQEVHEATTDPMRIIVSLPPLLPLAELTMPLTVRFVDAAGRESDDFVTEIRVADARAPEMIPYGYGLIWTSRPGPSQLVELALHWPAAAGQQHRVYIADAAGLGLSGERRAAIADAGVRMALEGRATGGEVRKVFRLLSETPVIADASGATLRATLPRALQTVQFVRIVPIGASGVEADFDACGLIPVAVPDDRAPPPPRLRAKPGGDGRSVTLTVEAVGLNLVLLERAEPGLFQHQADGAAASPEFRLRRAAGAVPDPVYARVIGTGLLTHDGAAPSFTALIEDDGDGSGLTPFTRYTYWAEVRMPAERRVVGVELPVAGAAQGVAAAQIEDSPGSWSAMSAPVTIISAPVGIPAAPLAEDAAATLSAGPMRGHTFVTLNVRYSPTAPGWNLRVWRGWGNEPLTQVMPDLPPAAGAVIWTEPAPTGATTVSLAIAWVDPLGRQGNVLLPQVRRRRISPVKPLDR